MRRAAAAAKVHEEEESRDLERFRELVRHGAPSHGYIVLLGLNTFDLNGLVRSVERGLPFRAFERLARNAAVSSEELTRLIDLPRRTLARRKQEGRFSAEESDRLVRAARLFAKALQLFEVDRESALQWLRSPQRALGGSVPLELARTELGEREVEAVMHRLEHGVFM